MKLTTFFLLVASVHVSAKGLSQTVNLSEKNAPLQKVIQAIEAQTEYVFFYNTNWLQQAKKVTIKADNVPIQEALDLCFKNQPLTYKISGKTITLVPKEDAVSRSPLIDISGKITDKDGNPLAGANVKIKGSNKGITTNADGSFTLKDVDENSVIEISYVGFETQMISLQGKKIIAVRLSPKNSVLDETVVIAYGTTTKRFNTGNVSNVKASEIEKQPVNNPLLALQGRVPGVQITQTSGLPGAGVVVRIQGQNSLANGNNPLYVVDGVPISTEIPHGSGGVGYSPLPNSGETYIRQSITGKGSALTYINPSDIESIEILKDADATAIYGSRAANGAILITTKKGKAGKTALNMDVQQGFGQVGHFMKLLNTAQYLEMRNEALKNDGLTPSASSSASGQFLYAPDLRIWDTTRQTDWQKEFIGGTAKYTHANASVSGGVPAIQYLIGANYHKETTVFPGEFSNQRGGMHFNLSNNDAAQKFHFQVSTNYSIDNNKLPRFDLTQAAVTLVPNAPALFNSDGTVNWEPDVNGNSTFVNPMAPLLYQNYESKTSNLIANGILNYDILPGLRIGASLGFNNLQSSDNQTNSTLMANPETRLLSSTQRTAYFGDSKVKTWIIEPQVSYKKALFNGKFDGLVGTTFQRTLREALVLQGAGFNNDLVMSNPAAAATVTTSGYVKGLYKYNAIFSRLNYIFKDRYILNLTGRRDGSTRFGSNNKFHNFWSAGAGWIFSEESFLRNEKLLLSFGKLKANYGTTGSDQIGDYRFLTLYNIVNPQVPYQGTTGLAPGDIPNPFLQWEETKKLSIGIDLGLFNNRIFITTNYSRNRSSNQLLDYNLPLITGRGNVLLNFPAKVENTSWEFSVSTENIKSKDFSWSTNINLTIPRNKLLEFENLQNTSYRDLVIGKPISIQKLYHYAGVDPTTGIYSMTDIHGNITTTPNFQNDRTVIISNFQKYYGGLQNSIQYKGLQLDFLFQFVNRIASSADFGFSTPVIPGRFSTFSNSGNQPIVVMNRWQKPGDITAVQKFAATGGSTANSAFSNLSASDEYASDASYIRLKNLSLSWEIPVNWKQKVRLQNCRLFAQGQNLLTITKYEGLDPETAGYSNLPPLRVITFGLQIKL